MDIQLITIKIIDKFTNTLLQVEELTQPKVPKLVFNGSDDKYQPIMTAEFSFNLYVKDNADGKFFHLYTGNERRYYVTVETELHVMLFEGWLLPDFYSEPFTNSVMFVDLTATDGIGGLKAHYLADSYYLGETSVVKLIAECLKKTGLQKKIYLAPSIVSAVTDYLWHEIAVDGNSYLDGDLEYGGLGGLLEMPARKNCYEIIELLCKDLGVTLFGWGDVWYLEGINRKHEEIQSFYEYDFNGEYIGVVSTTKNVVDINNYFAKDPTISVISPWKIVSVSWEIDEDGDLVPSWAVEDKTTGVLLQLDTIKDMFDFWKPNGQLALQSFSNQLKTKYQVIAGLGFDLGVSVAPNNLSVIKNIYLSGVSYAESFSTLEQNFISLLKRKYLKTSDQWMERSFKVNISINGGDKYTIDTVPNLPEGDYTAMFFYDLLSNTTKILSSKSGVSAGVSKKFDCKYQEHSFQYPSNIQVGDFYEVTSDTIRSTLKAEYVLLPSNGFFDIKLHAPVSPNPAAPYFYGYVVDSISVKYTEEKKRITELVRDIDFTTSIKVDCFHGDSVQDLSIKQFRFRRNIPMPETVTGEVEIYDFFEFNNGFVTNWQFVISSASAQNIINNYQLLTWSLPLPTGVINVDEAQQNPTNGNSNWQIRWSVNLIDGVWVLIMVPNSFFASIGIDILGSSLLYIDTGDNPIYGWVTENNEWRESWKRWDVIEDRRFGDCLGRVYNDVQPGPVIKIEGEIKKIISPREILAFEWQSNKQFIPTRLVLDFSEGTSNLVLNETNIQTISDYVN